jgi:hypothetical protein
MRKEDNRIRKKITEMGKWRKNKYSNSYHLYIKTFKVRLMRCKTD